ncbi:MAG: right-handed parallel beta-helix repeat-containing protein [Ignavibacteria bacterium]|nr:right-handed parallel beta-helix repeat-containing protein [Ignavibacteria bacterium]
MDWTLAGIPGGIPARTSISATIDAGVYGNGVTDATAAIQQALDASRDGEVVYLPAGVYKTSATIHLFSNRTLRGAGPGKTIIRFANDWGRSILDMRGLFYWNVYGLKRSFGIVAGGVKGSTQITLDSIGTIAKGDILLIDQRNDPLLVDPVGYEGLCTYCGREEGQRARGQIAEVTHVQGNTVSLNLPLSWTLSASLLPQATLVDAASMIRHAGIEDLTVTEDSAVVDYLIEMDGAQYCWLKNIEVTRVNRRGLWLIESLQNEVRDSYFHDAINGFGRSYGYGILVDAYASSNLIENNILHTLDGGFLMTAGGASGNVFGYNYMIDSRFDDPWWLTASPSLNHAPHPSMNLWEGNIGVQAAADFIHGSSSHNTVFRCRFSGWQDSVITSNNNAIELQYKNTHYNVLGCVLGTPGRSDTYETAYPTAPDNLFRNIWRLGYGGPSWAGDMNVKATLLRHRNYDYVTRHVVDDPVIADTLLPASLYKPAKPAWWGACVWPPIGPDVPGLVNKIPAQLRYENAGTTGVAIGHASASPGSRPSEYELFQNYPNPFGAAVQPGAAVTTLSFSIPEACIARLSVHDLLGRVVSTVFDGALDTGIHRFKWNADIFPSAAYLLRLTVTPPGGGSVSRERVMVLAR